MIEFLKSHGVTIRYKQDIWWCHVIGWLAWIVGYKQFMDRATTFCDSVALGKFEDPSVTIATHELTHVIQLRRVGRWLFYLGYLFSQRRRVRYEIQAFVVGWTCANRWYIPTDYCRIIREMMSEGYGINVDKHGEYIDAQVLCMMNNVQHHPVFIAYRQWERRNGQLG